MPFLKSKKIYLIISATIIVALVGIHQYRKSHQPPEYETIRVARGNLIQTVEATGKIQSVNGVALKFEVPGTIERIMVKAGNTIKAGARLANLRLAELNAAVAGAKANLDQKLAGATSEDRAYYEAAMASARAAYEQSKIDADTSVAAAEGALETAKNNLKLIEGGEESRIVAAAYATAVVSLQATLPKIDDALAQADNILGIDNYLANDSFESYLSSRDAVKLPVAEKLYKEAKVARDAARTAAAILTPASPPGATDAAFDPVLTALTKSSQLLTAVSDVLKATDAVGALTGAVLDTKKVTIETSRSTLNTQYTTILDEKQAVLDAKNSLSTYTIAYTKAERDLEQTKANAINSVKIKEAAFKQAEANWQSKVNPPRPVDVAALRAALAQAVAARAKAIITAPIDGLITAVNKKVGESAAAADAVIEMLAPHYEVTVDVPETDVAKLRLQNAAAITLDAFGDEVKFKGSVIAIDPGSTEIQDVVYYTVTITLADTNEPIKPGMTANVSVKTSERAGVLFVPLRSIRSKSDGAKYVKVLDKNQAKDIAVTLGLKANEGKAEIISGLQEGQEVIVSVKK